MSEINMLNADFTKQRADTMFQRTKEDKNVELKDFTIKSVIGRGSFGKVFLVELQTTKELFAVKSIRKDILIEMEQVDSTMLEKQIMFECDHPFLVPLEYMF